MKMSYFLSLLAGFPLAGCATTTTLVTNGLASRPYEATTSDADVAWDVGAMRYKRYADECPAFIGWLAFADLPLSAVADTALLPFLEFDRDDETNLVARPGSTAGDSDGGPSAP